MRYTKLQLKGSVQEGDTCYALVIHPENEYKINMEEFIAVPNLDNILVWKFNKVVIERPPPNQYPHFESS